MKCLKIKFTFYILDHENIQQMSKSRRNLIDTSQKQKCKTI